MNQLLNIFSLNKTITNFHGKKERHGKDVPFSNLLIHSIENNSIQKTISKKSTTTPEKTLFNLLANKTKKGSKGIINYSNENKESNTRFSNQVAGRLASDQITERKFAQIKTVNESDKNQKFKNSESTVQSIEKDNVDNININTGSSQKRSNSLNVNQNASEMSREPGSAEVHNFKNLGFVHKKNSKVKYGNDVKNSPHQITNHKNSISGKSKGLKTSSVLNESKDQSQSTGKISNSKKSPDLINDTKTKHELNFQLNTQIKDNNVIEKSKGFKNSVILNESKHQSTPFVKKLNSIKSWDWFTKTKLKNELKPQPNTQIIDKNINFKSNDSIINDTHVQSVNHKQVISPKSTTLENIVTGKFIQNDQNTSFSVDDVTSEIKNKLNSNTYFSSINLKKIKPDLNLKQTESNPSHLKVELKTEKSFNKSIKNTDLKSINQQISDDKHSAMGKIFGKKYEKLTNRDNYKIKTIKNDSTQKVDQVPKINIKSLKNWSPKNKNTSVPDNKPAMSRGLEENSDKVTKSVDSGVQHIKDNSETFKDNYNNYKIDLLNNNVSEIKNSDSGMKGDLANIINQANTASTPLFTSINTPISASTMAAVNQIINYINISSSGKSDIYSFKFDGGDLGTVKIQFQKDIKGDAAKIVVNNESARIFLQKILPSLQSELIDRGINLNSLDIELDNPKQRENGYEYQQTQNNSKQMISDKGENLDHVIPKSYIKNYGYNSFEVIA